MSNNTKNEITLDEVITLVNIQKKIFNQSSKMGREDRDFGTMIALCHSELSEALKGARKDWWDDSLTERPMVEVKLADCIIRILDLAALDDLDVAGALAEKHSYNSNRQYSEYQRENQ